MTSLEFHTTLGPALLHAAARSRTIEPGSPTVSLPHTNNALKEVAVRWASISHHHSTTARALLEAGGRFAAAAASSDDALRAALGSRQ